MLYTLLPIKTKKTLQREYRTRVLTVLLFMISVVIFIGAVSYFPVYIKALFEEKSVNDKIASLKSDKDETGLSRVEKELSSDGVLLAVLQKDSGNRPLSAVVEDLSELRGPVKINSFSVDRVATSSASVIIQGFALTRNDLLSFKSRLENHSPGSMVDLPILDLKQNANIQFSITIIQPLP